MTRTATILAMTAALASPLAQAELPIDKVEDTLKAAESYGFTHYTEIEFEDNGSAEVEGWTEKGTKVEVQLSATGDVTSEDKKNDKDEPAGATIENLRFAVETAKAEGMTKVEDMSSHKAGEVEIEGEKSDGKDLDLSVMTAQRD